MSKKYTLRVVSEAPTQGDEVDGYDNALVTSESALQVYESLDGLGSGPLLIQVSDEETLDQLLTQFRKRKLACGNYLLKRNIFIVMEEIPDGLSEKWKRMIDDGVLSLK